MRALPTGHSIGARTVRGVISNCTARSRMCALRSERCVLPTAAFCRPSRADERALRGILVRMVAAPILKMNEHEYLAWEREQSGKHQYIDGEVYAMSGGSARHSLLSFQAAYVLKLAYGKGPCRPFTSDLQVYIPVTGNYVYPDVSVVCGTLEQKNDTDAVTNPSVLIEVLSKSTEAHDRGGKWRDYQSIASLQDYLLIAQHEARIEHFQRTSSGPWTYYVYYAGDRIVLGNGATLALDEIYEGAFDIPVRDESPL